MTCVILEAAPTPCASSLDDIRDVTGRVSRWTLIFHRDEQGFVVRSPALDRGRVELTTSVPQASAARPCAGAANEKVRSMRHRGV